MQAGKLDRRLTLRRNTPTTDEFGGEAPNWADVETVWASKEDIRDAERVRAQQVGASISTRFQIRPLANGERPSVKDQVVCEGITYAITNVKEIGRRSGWELTTTAQIP